MRFRKTIMGVLMLRAFAAPTLPGAARAVKLERLRPARAFPSFRAGMAGGPPAGSLRIARLRASYTGALAQREYDLI